MKIIYGGVGTICTIVAAAFAIDSRYARSADVAALHQGQIQIVNQTRAETRYAADLLRKQLLEDKIFELNLIPEHKRTDVQRALLERYKAQVQEINNRWPSPPSPNQ